MDKVRSVKSDMASHTVTVTFDDAEVSLDAIIQALNDTGYTVGEPRKLLE